MISNDNVLERQHKSMGIDYVSRQPDGSFNDSEALIYDIARYLEGEVEYLTASGSIAFIVIKRNKDGKPVTLFFGRNSGNPLKMKLTKNSLTLSSEGDGESIETNTLYSYSYETGDIVTRPMTIPYMSRWGNSYSASTSNHSLTYGGYTKGYEADVYDQDDDYYRSAEAQAIIQDTEFHKRVGTQSRIKDDILREANNDYTEASIQAIVEATEAEAELDRINMDMYGASYDLTARDLGDYWFEVNAYKKMMADIAVELEDLAVVMGKIQEAVDAKKSKDSIKVTNAERSLLPYAS